MMPGTSYLQNDFDLDGKGGALPAVRASWWGKRGWMPWK